MYEESGSRAEITARDISLYNDLVRRISTRGASLKCENAVEAHILESMLNSGAAVSSVLANRESVEVSGTPEKAEAGVTALAPGISVLVDHGANVTTICRTTGAGSLVYRRFAEYCQSSLNVLMRRG